MPRGRTHSALAVALLLRDLGALLAERRARGLWQWKIVSFSRAACWYPALVDPVQHAIVREPLVPADGWLDVPTGPGLGIDIDEAALERLAVEHFSVA